ncbi:MAG TPA: hypothetical protein VLU41_00190 [Ideonella sp.]|nr:hypothetical protein [Ideonella sp.]
MMKRTAVWAGQAVLYALFALALGVFSHWPSYQHLAADQALIKVSFVHPGQRVAECRRRTAEELAKLPPNMRAPMQCGRERAPVRIEVELDGRPAFAAVARPSGLSKDGPSAVYQRLVVPAGTHRLVVRFKDSAGTGGFDQVREADVKLEPAQVLVIDYDASKGGITLS